MANNRIYIRCKKCGEIVHIGSHTMTAYNWSRIDKSYHLEDLLNDFYEEHCFCNKELNEEALKMLDTPLGKYENWDNNFEIAYEYED